MKNEINHHVMTQYGNEFRALCAPIFNNTPINYIGLAKIYNDGSRSYLITDPKWGEVLLENNYHLAGTEDALIQNSGLISHQLWSISSMFTLNKQTQQLFSDCVAANYGNGITLIEKGKNYTEFFHICANSSYDAINPFLVNNIDLLWNYVLFIREKLHKCNELKKAYEIAYQYNLDSHKSDSAKQSSNKNSLEFEIKKFYLGGNFENTYFTKREMLCLILLYQNYSCKEQAKILNISYRTVEHIIENIKSKTQIRSTLQLIIELAQNYIFTNLVNKYKF